MFLVIEIFKEQMQRQLKSIIWVVNEQVVFSLRSSIKKQFFDVMFESAYFCPKKVSAFDQQ